MDIIDTRTNTEVLDAILADRGGITHQIHPIGVAKTRAALRNSRGEANGALREVTLDWDSLPAARDADRLEVVGPKDGRPIVIRVPSGFPALVVVSGYAVIVFNSACGNHATIESGAVASIFAGAGRKVSITTQTGGIVSFYGETGTRGLQHVEDGGLFTAHGDIDDILISDQERRAVQTARWAAEERARVLLSR